MRVVWKRHPSPEGAGWLCEYRGYGGSPLMLSEQKCLREYFTACEITGKELCLSAALFFKKPLTKSTRPPRGWQIPDRSHSWSRHSPARWLVSSCRWFLDVGEDRCMSLVEPSWAKAWSSGRWPQCALANDCYQHHVFLCIWLLAKCNINKLTYSFNSTLFIFLL